MMPIRVLLILTIRIHRILIIIVHVVFVVRTFLDYAIITVSFTQESKSHKFCSRSVLISLDRFLEQASNVARVSDTIR